jgi:hydroxymethylpyrimidine pyrophosphatase-like HAD family hydrolase
MGQKYKLLVTDLDGTLLDANGHVHERDRVAVVELLRRGVPIAVCTGRMYSGTRDIARFCGVQGPVACVDGVHIVNASNDRDLWLRNIDPSAAEALFRVLTEHRPTTFVFSNDTLFHDDGGLPYLPYVHTWSRRAQVLADAIAHFGANGDSVSGLVSLGTEEQIHGAHALIAREAPEHLQSATFPLRRPEFEGLWGMVVRAAGVNKATAVEWIARHYRIDPSEVVAVGDWLNDIPMLKCAGRSFAMAQAPDVVKASATDVLEADVTTGGGIAEAAERSELL